MFLNFIFTTIDAPATTASFSGAIVIEIGDGRIGGKLP
jgi:hypothetical protein